MDDSIFNSLMNKIESVEEWAIFNINSDAKKFKAEINGQIIEIYSCENSPLYINDIKPELTEAQNDLVLLFVNDLVSSYQEQINSELSQLESNLEFAIQQIIA